MFSTQFRQSKIAEHVDAGRCRLLDEIAHHVVRVVGVADRVGAAQQHLQQHVRHALAQIGQAVPRVLLEEAHRDVEGGPAPAFQREQPRQRGARRLGATATMSWVRMRVASSDWCASRMVVSVSSTRVCSQHPLRRTPSAPSSSSSCRGARGGVAGRARTAAARGARRVGRRGARPVTSGWPLTMTSAMNVRAAGRAVAALGRGGTARACRR